LYDSVLYDSVGRVSCGWAAAPTVTQQREFWVLMGWAVVLGVSARSPRRRVCWSAWSAA
jgi:hypothetical protein